MEFTEAKKSFIQLWGNFGSQWGINKSMAQLHALLLVSTRPMHTDEVMETLSISRGNANMNLRDLLSWNLIYKVSVQGDRREYFRAEKDMWEVAKRITRERKRREIEPLQQHLLELSKVEGAETADKAEFELTIAHISRLVSRMDGMTDALMKADEHVFFGKILNLLK